MRHGESWGWHPGMFMGRGPWGRRGPGGRRRLVGHVRRPAAAGGARRGPLPGAGRAGEAAPARLRDHADHRGAERAVVPPEPRGHLPHPADAGGAAARPGHRRRRPAHLRHHPRGPARPPGASRRGGGLLRALGRFELGGERRGPRGSHAARGPALPGAPPCGAPRSPHPGGRCESSARCSTRSCPRSPRSSSSDRSVARRASAAAVSVPRTRTRGRSTPRSSSISDRRIAFRSPPGCSAAASRPGEPEVPATADAGSSHDSSCPADQASAPANSRERTEPGPHREHTDQHCHAEREDVPAPGRGPHQRGRRRGEQSEHHRTHRQLQPPHPGDVSPAVVHGVGRSHHGHRPAVDAQKATSAPASPATCQPMTVHIAMLGPGTT